MSLIKSSISLNKFRQISHDLAISTHHAEQALAKDAKHTFIDLFAGIGGVRIAFEREGANCVFSSEYDIHAQLTYYKNHGVVPFGDITKISESYIPDHNILCAGFPCQPFSHIGRREGFKHPTQGTMFHEIIRVIEYKKPTAIFLENVVGIVNHDGGKTLKVILKSLEGLGYNSNYTILNSADFGVPQNRKRFYLVAFREPIDFKFPTPPMLGADVGDIIESNVSGYTISKHLQKTYLFKEEDGRPELIDQNTQGPVKTLVSSYHKIQRLTGTFVKGGKTGVRLLTVNECKGLMGFPEEFVFPVSRTQMYRQMGNSVAIPVVQSIAKEIIKSLKGIAEPRNKNTLEEESHQLEMNL
ncbi:MAG TPA: DNA cytosine methyltransferase [Chitinophagaceae bacterium]|nr:DNA cytosine methyltransferase [Chitinophagaceae bacterium]